MYKNLGESPPPLSGQLPKQIFYQFTFSPLNYAVGFSYLTYSLFIFWKLINGNHYVSDSFWRVVSPQLARVRNCKCVGSYLEITALNCLKSIGHFHFKNSWKYYNLVYEDFCLFVSKEMAINAEFYSLFLNDTLLLIMMEYFEFSSGEEFKVV